MGVMDWSENMSVNNHMLEIEDDKISKSTTLENLTLNSDILESCTHDNTSTSNVTKKGVTNVMECQSPFKNVINIRKGNPDNFIIGH